MHFNNNFKLAIVKQYKMFINDKYPIKFFLKFINHGFGISKSTFYDWIHKLKNINFNDENHVLSSKYTGISISISISITPVIETFIINNLSKINKNKTSIKKIKFELFANYKIKLSSKQICIILNKNNIFLHNSTHNCPYNIYDNSFNNFNETKSNNSDLKIIKSKSKFNNEIFVIPLYIETYIIDNITKYNDIKSLTLKINNEFNMNFHTKQIIFILHKNKLNIKSYYKISLHIEKFIIKCVTNNPIVTAQDIKQLIKNEFNIDISKQSVYNVLKKFNFKQSKLKIINNQYSIDEQIEQVKNIINPSFVVDDELNFEKSIFKKLLVNYNNKYIDNHIRNIKIMNINLNPNINNFINEIELNNFEIAKLINDQYKNNLIFNNLILIKTIKQYIKYNPNNLIKNNSLKKLLKQYGFVNNKIHVELNLKNINDDIIIEENELFKNYNLLLNQIQTYDNELNENITNKFINILKNNIKSNNKKNKNLIDDSVFKDKYVNKPNFGFNMDTIENVISIDEISFLLNSKPIKGWFNTENHEYKIECSNIRSIRYSIVVATTNKKILSYYICEGGLKSEAYIDFIKNIYNDGKNKNKIFFMDNAKIHTSKIFKDFAINNKINVLYNAPYHSEFNPIEYVFSMLRNYLNRNLNKTYDNLIIALENFKEKNHEIEFTNIFKNCIKLMNKFVNKL